MSRRCHYYGKESAGWKTSDGQYPPVSGKQAETYGQREEKQGGTGGRVQLPGPRFYTGQNQVE